MSLIAVETASALGDVRKVKYSTEMAVVGFPPQNRDERHSLEDLQLELNKLQSASVQLDLKLPSPKCSQSHYQSGKDNVCPKSVISYKEYKAWKEVEQKALAADKFTPGKEEDWDAEPSLPPWETPPGASSMAPSQEDELKQMINQDPCSGSITGNSGQGTMTATRETESMEDLEWLCGIPLRCEMER